MLAPQYGDLIGAGGGLAAQAILLRYGRDAELESDRLGVGYAAANGWEPRAMQGLLGTLARLDEAQGSRRGIPNWALTHPPAADRVVKSQETIAATKTPSAPATNRTEFERVVDGVVFGDSREKGIVRGNEFLHPILRFALRFPNGWNVANGAEQVVGCGEGRRQRRDAARIRAKRRHPSSRRRGRRWRRRDCGKPTAERTRINGLDAYVGTYEGVSGNTRIGVRAAHIRSGQQTYLVAGLSSVSDFSRVQSQFATRSSRSARSRPRKPIASSPAASISSSRARAIPGSPSPNSRAVP